MSQTRSAITVDAQELAARFQQGRVNINTLFGNDTVRAEIRSAAVTAALADLQGNRNLTPEQRQTQAERIADQRLNELRSLADSRGYISGARAAQVFRWLDSFDRNGSSRSFNLFANADASNETMTVAGHVYRRVLESTELDVRFNEEEFVAGFMNGSFDPQKFRELRPEQVELLRRAGVYDQLRARLERSQLPQDLSADSLSRMFRRLDAKVDQDGDGSSMTARGPGAASQRETPFPLEMRRPEQADENSTYKTLRVLRDIFRERRPSGPSRDEARPDTLVPPPSPELTENPLTSGRSQPLASRSAIEFDTFANYHRDARLNLAELERNDPAAWRQLTEAFTAAGVDINELRRLGQDNVIGGNGDRDAAGASWQRLHNLLARDRFGGRNGVIRPWVNGVDGERTHAGRILEVLDRHTERFTLRTRQDLASDFSTGIIDASRLRNEIDTPTGRRPLGDVLRESGLDPAELQRNAGNPTALASYVYDTLGAREGNRAAGMRPNTLALSTDLRGQHADTEAGRAVALIRRHMLTALDQEARSYTRRDTLDPANALRDPNVRPVQISTRFHGYRDSDPAGCFRRASESIASSGMARTSSSGGYNHYNAHGASNTLGAISGQGVPLTRSRRALDGMLDLGLPVQIAVMRRGEPGAAAGNPGSGVRHSLIIDQRGVDEQGRVFYEGWDNATSHRDRGRQRFYVNPRTNLLYSPTNPGGPVYLSEGGYQMSMVKMPSWVRLRSALPGTRSDGRAPRDGLQGYHVVDANAFFRHFTGGDLQGPMVAPPVRRTTRRTELPAVVPTPTPSPRRNSRA